MERVGAGRKGRTQRNRWQHLPDPRDPRREGGGEGMIAAGGWKCYFRLITSPFLDSPVLGTRMDLSGD